MKKKFIIISAIIIVVFCIALAPVVFQNDTFYTIKIGELILNNGIDMIDHFSIHNLPYTYPHWLYDVIIYLIYSLGGYTALYISNIICFITIIALIFYYNYQNNHSKFITLAFTILSTLLLSSYVVTRAQLVSYIIFILEYIFITNYLKNGNKKNLIGLFILSLILCNIHVAVWPFYFIIYLPFIAEYIIAKLFKKDKILFNRIEISKNNRVKVLVITMLICLIPGFLTPIKDTPFTYLLNTMKGNSQSYIKEHLPPDLSGKIVLSVFSFAIVALSLLGKIKLHQIFLVLGLSLMAFTSNRHLSLYVIFIFPIMANLTDNVFNKYKIDVDKYTIKYLLTRLGIIITSILLLFILCSSIYSKRDISFVSEEVYPIDAVKYIKENLDYKNIRIFNEYNYGSYLILNDIPVFIDSRADLYTKEFNHKEDIFKEYMSSNYPMIIDKYNLTHIIASKDNNLYNYTKNIKNYHILYEDEYFVVYEIIKEDI